MKLPPHASLVTNPLGPNHIHVLLYEGETLLPPEAGRDFLQKAAWRLVRKHESWMKPGCLWTNADVYYQGQWLHVGRTDCYNRVDTSHDTAVSTIVAAKAMWIEHVCYGLILAPTDRECPRVCCIDAMTDG